MPENVVFSNELVHQHAKLIRVFRALGRELSQKCTVLNHDSRKIQRGRQVKQRRVDLVGLRAVAMPWPGCTS